jgi:hypothetical protein
MFDVVATHDFKRRRLSNQSMLFALRFALTSTILEQAPALPFETKEATRIVLIPKRYNVRLQVILSSIKEISFPVFSAATAAAIHLRWLLANPLR